MECIFPECQEGHYPLGYQDYGDGEGYVVWGACPCCGGENWKDCPTCTARFTELPFNDMTATDDDTTAAYHGQERAV